MSPIRVERVDDDFYLEESRDPEVIEFTYHHNSEAWRGPLSKEDYIERELYLRSHSEMLNRSIAEPPLGIYLYVLRKRSIPSRSKFDNIVAAVEVLIRKAWRADGSGRYGLQVVNCATVGNVFTLKEHRKRGYASVLMKRLNTILDQSLGNGGFSILYSEVGSFYSKFGFQDKHVGVSYISSMAVLKGELPAFQYLNSEDYDDLIHSQKSYAEEELIIQSRYMKPNDVAVSLIPTVEIYNQINLKECFIHKKLDPDNLRVVKKFGAKLNDSNDYILWNHDWKSKQLVITKHFIESSSLSEDYKESLLKLLFLAGIEAQSHNLSEICIWDTSLSKDPKSLPEVHKLLKSLSSKARCSQENPSLCAIRINDQNGNEKMGEIHWIENEKWCWY